MSNKKIKLQKVQIRPLINSEEINRWNTLVKDQHYLKSSSMVGEQIRYVAEYEGNWVACLGCSAATLKSRLRTEYLGWSPIQETQRRQLIVQNARFLILKDFSVPNLASKCLSLLSKRISSDWQEKYGHPVYLLETFVDLDRPGTCYKACGWEKLGLSAGFRREVGGYSRHGIKKSYWVFPLRKNVQHLLSKDKLSDDKILSPLKINQLPIADSKNKPNIHDILKKYFPKPSNLKRNGAPYDVSSTIGLILTGFLCGCVDSENIAGWAKELDTKFRIALGCPYRIRKGVPGYQVPCANTIRYTLQDVDARILEKAMIEWAELCGINTENTVLALDGKVLRGAKTEDQRAPTHVTLYDVKSGVVIDQELVPNKTNEIPIARDIFERNNLSGSLITADAAHTNHASANAILKKTAISYLPSKTINLSFSNP